MSAASSLGLRPCFADLDALVPRVADIGVTSTSTVFEPGTAATATTAFPRFSDGTALTTYGPSGRRGCDCWDIYVSIGKKTKRKTLGSQCLVVQLHVIRLELTFAGLHAFRPHVNNIFAAASSTLLEPSTARSATTDSA